HNSPQASRNALGVRNLMLWRSIALHGAPLVYFGHLSDTGSHSLPKPRNAKLESATARRKLAVRKKPYYVRLSPGIALGYRRNAGAGTWTVRVADGGAEWVKRIAVADDLEPASPPHVLSYWQAIDLARSLARRQPGDAIDESRPLTVSEALTLYEKDLVARGGNPYNAEHPRAHPPAVILTKPVNFFRPPPPRPSRHPLFDHPLAPRTL